LWSNEKRSGDVTPPSVTPPSSIAHTAPVSIYIQISVYIHTDISICFIHIYMHAHMCVTVTRRASGM